MSDALMTVKIWFLAVLSGLSWVLTYAGIDQEVFVIFVVLLLSDFVTGILKARAMGEKFDPDKANYGVISKFSMILIPLVVALAAKAIGADAGSLFVWGMNLLILSETYSVIGNVYMINKGKELPEWDVISILGSQIREMLIRPEGKSEEQREEERDAD